MARPESIPDFRWQQIKPRGQEPYNQLTTRRLVGNQRVLDELFASKLTADRKNKSAMVLDGIAGKMIDLVHLGGVVTALEDLSPLSEDLEQSDPEAFELLKREIILNRRDFGCYPWGALDTYAGKGFGKPYRDFLVVRSQAYKALFHDGKRIYLNNQDWFRALGKPKELIDIFKKQVVQAYEEAQIPHHLAPGMVARQSLYDICNELGLGRQNGISKSIRNKYFRLS